MILDNADHSEIFFSNLKFEPKNEQQAPLISFIPHSSKGLLILTSRDQRAGQRLADPENVAIISALDMQEGKSLIRLKLPKNINFTDEEASELLTELELLPLAITQATAFISENNVALVAYIARLRASELIKLLDQNLPDSRRDIYASSSIKQTWKLSFDHTEKNDQRAAYTLSLMAVLDRQAIPKSLLRKENDSETDLNIALGTLQAFSLITAERGGETYVLHRLVQIFTQDRLKSQHEIGDFQDQALELVSKALPVGTFENQKFCEQLLPHAQVVLTYQSVSDGN